MGFSKVIAWVAAAIAIPFPTVGGAQEEPEAVYRKFHDATLARNFKEIRKWGTAQIGSELAAAPAKERDAMIAFLAGMMPRSYAVLGKEISPDSAKAILRLCSRVADKGKVGTVLGTVTLLKESGAWKVLEANWGGDQPSGPSTRECPGAVEPARHAPLSGTDADERKR